MYEAETLLGNLTRELYIHRDYYAHGNVLKPNKLISSASQAWVSGHQKYFVQHAIAIANVSVCSNVIFQ